MEYRNSGDSLVNIVKYTNQELLALIKTQIKFVIKFMVQDGEDLRQEHQIWLFERFVEGGVQKINVALDEKGNEPVKITYDRLMQYFEEYIAEKDYLINITSPKDSFIDALPLLKHVNEFTEEHIAGAISLAYRDGYFSFKFKAKNNKPEEVHFWPATKTLYYFSSEQGPNFMYKTSLNNVSELIKMLG